MKKITSLALATLLLALVSANAETPQKAKPESLQAWRDARFGMFILWGPVSLTGKEISWSRANSNPQCPNHGPTPIEVYDNLYKQFDPVKFDAKEWVAIAKAAGMKYMILTAKHCDGFLLWDSKVDDYNIMRTPFKRDVCAELAKAAHEAGMKIGWYFSPMDWRDPDCRNAKNAEFVKRMQGELTELLSNYGKIDILWFDGDGRPKPWDQQNTYALTRRLQPDIVINDRLDKLGSWEDFYTPEQRVGGFDNQRPWESCMTVSARNQWSWGGAKDGVKSYKACMNMLLRCAGGDGNVLLNVGPTPTGEIAPEQANRIKEMGTWLAKFGASIYGTRGGPFKPGKFGVSTHKGNTIYLHIQSWSGETLTLPAIPAKILRGQALTGGTATVKQTDDAIEIALPAGDRQEIDTVIALELNGPAGDIAPLAMTKVSPSLASGKKATASNVYRGSAEYGAGKAFDDDSETRWAADSGTKSAWLEVDLGKPAAIGRAVIEQAYPELKRVRKFAIEYRDGEEWKTCYQGENLGAELDAKFAPVTAQHVRLNITEATDGPTIFEFQLFPPDK
ncbi:MAG: alpha-L-fucosidase [Candidatus Sumerlaeota bacterium]|nr:alpha-L-fucosidase [Candidatus Sumerlaeota bacterium]